MKNWMKQGIGYPPYMFVEHVNIREYEDTKIKLHFSHFKILDAERTTCFRDEPHQCEEFKGGQRKNEGAGILGMMPVL